MRFGRVLVTMLVDQQRWKEAEPLAVRVLAIEDSLKEDSLGRVAAGQRARIYAGRGEEAGALTRRRVGGAQRER